MRTPAIVSNVYGEEVKNNYALVSVRLVLSLVLQGKYAEAKRMVKRDMLVDNYFKNVLTEEMNYLAKAEIEHSDFKKIARFVTKRMQEPK